MEQTCERTPLAWLGYGLALMLIIGPAMDFSVATYPWSPATVSWRFGALGLLGNALILPTVAVGILAITAGSLSHRRFLRLIAVAALFGAVALTVGLLMLALDTLQLRRNVRPDILPGFDFGALRVGVNYLLSIGMNVCIGAAVLRATRKRQAETREARAEKSRGRSLLVRTGPPRSDP